MHRLLPALCLLAALPTAAAREPFAGDGYGYQPQRSPDASCPYQWIAPPPGSELAAGDADDGAAALALSEPFEWYGVPANALAVAVNGYLAATDGGEADSGADFSPDCPLPAVPDPGPSSPSRILALHDDWMLGAGGSLHASHHAPCPRASGALAGEACTIVTWQALARSGGSDPVASFQAVLYHGSHALALQYQAVPADPGNAVLGIQRADLGLGGTLGCGGQDPMPAAASAVCLFDPRFPAGAVAPPELLSDGFESPDDP